MLFKSSYSLSLKYSCMRATQRIKQIKTKQWKSNENSKLLKCNTAQQNYFRLAIMLQGFNKNLFLEHTNWLINNANSNHIISN